MVNQLIRFAKKEFAGRKTDRHGASNQEKIKSIERQTGRKIKIDILEEDLPDSLPLSLAYIWDWFVTLNIYRNSSFSIAPIQISEMKSFFEMINVDILPWELSALMRVDLAFLEVHRESTDNPKTD